MTHAAVWAAACSYIMQSTEPELRSSAQGVMQGIYQSLGRGSGSILGGVVIHRFGNSDVLFYFFILTYIIERFASGILFVRSFVCGHVGIVCTRQLLPKG